MNAFNWLRPRKDSSVDFRGFIKEIKSGRRDILIILEVPESNFSDASFEELLSNEADVLSGVNRVQMNFRNVFFSIFHSCLIKHIDDGSIKFVFYTQTRDFQKIMSFSSILFEEIGPGMYDNERFVSFLDSQAVQQLCHDKYNCEKDIVHYWGFENISLVLQYKPDPYQQFSLMLTISQEKSLDKEVRKKGTVLQLLDFDLNTLFLMNEIEGKQHVNDEGIVFTDFNVYCGNDIGLGFDTLQIRIFEDGAFFDEERQTNVTLSSSKKMNLKQKTYAIEKLLSLYGDDDRSSGYLAYHEIEILENSEFWTGRSWSFNAEHRLWDMNNDGERLVYSVTISDYNDVEGFNVSILGYNKLRLFADV